MRTLAPKELEPGMILAEDEAQERHLVGQRAQAVQGVQGGVPPAF